MPGVIMENGIRNGVHTNHDRQPRQNGVNGAGQPVQLEKLQDTESARNEPQQNMTPTSPNLPNGVNGTFSSVAPGKTSNSATRTPEAQAKVNQLPPELVHVTAGYVPWANLLTRQAQRSFAGMTTLLQTLVDMPMPPSRANGYNPQNPSSDDNSQENLNKKVLLLKFLQSTHADWAKQLALTQWSRKADDISRLVDLQTHLREEKWLYVQLIDTLCETKRGLLGATLPNPDLRTALEVLSSGTVSWMPELGYISPPPLTAKDILHQLEDLNTLLSIRMNLHEYDALPFYFKNYSISSGRVTFKVPGEFDVDLAIASEDPETQFWFIDLRFTFSPTPADMDPTLRFQIEQKINEVLLQDGLSGCYKYLHEIVLTRKILETRRQAMDLARGRWIEGLRIEQLNRTLSIQYWVDRYVKGPKSWILLGVHSGKSKAGRDSSKNTSQLSIRWFRDGKEVKDADIPFNATEISAEALLKSVVAKHVNHILTTIHDQLQSKPIFAQSTSSLTILPSSTEPAESVLKVQLTSSVLITIKIEPISGRFIIGPASPRIAETEYKINLNSQDPTTDAHHYIDLLRCTSLTEEIQRHATSVGWQRTIGPKFRPELLKALLPKDTIQTAWFSRPGWLLNWHLAISLGTSGEKWWLFESVESPQGRAIGSHICIPINSISPTPSYAFMSTLNVFVAAILSNYANTKALHLLQAFHAVQIADKPQKGVVLPSVYARLSQLLPSKNVVSRTGKPWAKDVIRITFQGLETLYSQTTLTDSPESAQSIKTDSQASDVIPPQVSLQKPQPPQSVAVIVTEAKMMVPLPKSVITINDQIDRDIAFHADSGCFAFRLRSRVGEAVIPDLVERVTRVERLVDYVQVLQSHEPYLKCEAVTLGKISFSYAMRIDMDVSTPDRLKSDQRLNASIDFSNVEKIILVLDVGDPHLRILDLLNQTLNSSQGFTGVAKLLPVTLPALRGLDALQATWKDLSNLGECFVLVRAAECYIIRYIINHSQATPDQPPRSRKFNFVLKLQDRKGSPFWHVRRADTVEGGKDALDNALQSVWNAKGEKWLGMRLSGVASPLAIEGLLSAVDDVVRSVALNPVESSPPNTTATLPPSQGSGGVGGKPQQRPPSMNQQRQQGAQSKQNNQRQISGNNQGKGNPLAREVVVLD